MVWSCSWRQCPVALHGDSPQLLDSTSSSSSWHGCHPCQQLQNCVASAEGTDSCMSPAPETHPMFGFGAQGWQWVAGGGSSGRCVPHLDVPDTDLRGAALHVAVVATPRAALHLHAGRPHHEVGIGAVHHVAGDFKDHLPCLALRKDSCLCCCQSIYGGPREKQEM